MRRTDSTKSVRQQAGRKLFSAVLCPVDFSAPSRGALRHAGALVSACGGQLSVLWVQDAFLAAAASAAGYDTKLMETTSDKELRTFARRGIDGLGLPASSVHFVIAVGDPAAEIIKTAQRLRSDLIVMATRGLGGASRLVLGSTTEAVLRKAGVPVLAVPPKSART